MGGARLDGLLYWCGLTDALSGLGVALVATATALTVVVVLVAGWAVTVTGTVPVALCRHLRSRGATYADEDTAEREQRHRDHQCTSDLLARHLPKVVANVG